VVFFGAVVAATRVVCWVATSAGAEVGTAATSGNWTCAGDSTVDVDACRAASISSMAVPLGLPPIVPSARCVPVFCLGEILFFFFLVGLVAAFWILCSIAKISDNGKKLRVLGS
jgi:hypothetical protein